MIGLDRALRHTAWADAKLFDELAALPPAALACTYASSGQSVAYLAAHIVGGAEWYCYVLAGRQWTDLQPPTNAEEVNALALHLADLNADLLAQADQPDGLVEFIDEDGPRTALRSTVLIQAPYHSTEHRAQISLALELNGYEAVRLDDYDAWAFAAQEQ
jgi:uncharacterized damage-inducible protein DinB